MAQPIQTPQRFGYIRTISHPDQEGYKINELFHNQVRQTSPNGITDGEPRHVFFFTAVNTTDGRFLEGILSSVTAREPVTECKPKGHWGPHGSIQHACRSDFQLHICDSRASTKAGRKLLRLCTAEGIQTAISGATDEECDEIMLGKSNYLIDFCTRQYTRSFEFWYSNARSGRLQRHELNDPSYLKTDVGWRRLTGRYLGYGWRASSGCFHGNGPWRCQVCGGQCKRNKCKSGGAALLERETKEAEYARIVKACKIPNHWPSYPSPLPKDPTATHHPSCGGKCKRGGCLVGGKAAQRQQEKEEQRQKARNHWKVSLKPGDERWRQMSSNDWYYWEGLQSVDTFSDDG